MRKRIPGVMLLLIAMLFGGIAHAQQSSAAERYKSEFLYRINSVRARGCNCGTKWFPPAPPLTWNGFLQRAAYGHAKDMNDRNYFNHTSKDGRTMEDRIVLAGYIFNGYKSFFIGENIAQGQQSIQEVTDAWFKSPDHCHNLMNPMFKEVAVVQYNNTWVQDFGGRESFSPSEQRALLSGKAKISQIDKN